MAEIIEMPKLSDTMSVGTLIKWLKQEGDKVESGEMIAEVETDKATMEVENFFEGVLLKQYVAEGGQVPINTPICAIGEAGEAPPEISTENSASGTGQPASAAKKPAETASPAKPAAAKNAPSAPDSHQTGSSAADSRVKASPLARKIAEEHNILIDSIKGSGPGGRIVKQDVLDAVENGLASAGSSTTRHFASPSAAVAEDIVLPLSNMRRTIATRLVESKTQIPHFYLDIEVNAAALLKLRADLNQQLAGIPPEQGGIKFTVNDFILKATTEALRRVPAVNASWNLDSITQYGSVQMAFGVAIPDGLVTPVIRHAETKSLRVISAEAKALISKARDKKLTPDEMSGSTFTVTNLGMYGITGFSGIINPPNAAILAVGSTLKKPIVDAEGVVVPGQIMSLGLSCDHRVIDGATGAEFLSTLKQILETPTLMLV